MGREQGFDLLGYPYCSHRVDICCLDFLGHRNDKSLDVPKKQSICYIRVTERVTLKMIRPF
jgi:hypothetical protein